MWIEYARLCLITAGPKINLPINSTLIYVNEVQCKGQGQDAAALTAGQGNGRPGLTIRLHLETTDRGRARLLP